MKNFSEFRTQSNEKHAEEKNREYVASKLGKNHISLKESEELNETHISMPPNILVLRRQSVRQFPDHTMVALYYSDKLDQYFSIPYGNDTKQVVTPTSLREESLNEDVLNHLKSVVNFETSSPLKHKDGTKTKVDPTTANALLTVHNSLHPDNQKKFLDHLEHSKPKFNRMLDFTWKSVK